MNDKVGSEIAKQRERLVERFDELTLKINDLTNIISDKMPNNSSENSGGVDPKPR